MEPEDQVIDEVGLTAAIKQPTGGTENHHRNVAYRCVRFSERFEVSGGFGFRRFPESFLCRLGIRIGRDRHTAIPLRVQIDTDPKTHRTHAMMHDQQVQCHRRQEKPQRPDPGRDSALPILDRQAPGIEQQRLHRPADLAVEVEYLVDQVMGEMSEGGMPPLMCTLPAGCAKLAAERGTAVDTVRVFAHP